MRKAQVFIEQAGMACFIPGKHFPIFTGTVNDKMTVLARMVD
jgi:hypothetical protein